MPPERCRCHVYLGTPWGKRVAEAKNPWQLGDTGPLLQSLFEGRHRAQANTFFVSYEYITVQARTSRLSESTDGYCMQPLSYSNHTSTRYAKKV